MTLNWLTGVDDGRVLYATVFESLVQAILGNYVKSGMVCTAGTGLSVDVSSGVVVYAGNEYSYDGGTVTLQSALSDKDRADVIVWDYNDGSPVVTVLTGVRWYDDNGTFRPLTERISDSQIPIAVVIVRAGATAVSSSDVLDVRVSASVFWDNIHDKPFESFSSIPSSILPSLGNSYDLGSPTKRWRNGYFAGTVDAGSLNIGGTSVITSEKVLQNIASFNQNILPTSDNSFDLGSSTQRWRHGWFSGTLNVSSNYILARSSYVIPREGNQAIPFIAIPASNPLAFKTPYRIEKYDPSTGTWVEWTDAPNFAPLTDLTASSVIISLPQGTTIRFRLYYDIGRFRYISKLALQAHWVDSLLYVKVESSSTSDFSSDVSVHLEDSPNLWLWDHYVVFNLNGLLYERYLRITFEFRSGGENKIKLSELIAIAPSDAYGILEGWHPFAWDYTRTVSFYNTVRPIADASYDLGASTYRWRDLYLSRNANVGGSVYVGGSEVITSDRTLKNIASVDQNVLPKVDNLHSLGSSSLRWANIYGVNVYAGDLCFEEKECAVCGQPFEVDDEIVLKAYKIDEYTRTVPIHLRCSKAYKELEVRLKLIEEKDGGGV